jgi:prepilin-type N-terminal cleavage/methylation domain-containing protein
VKRSHFARKHRRAYTLIEIMVTMSIGTVVMMVAAGWIHQSMKTASIMRQRERQHQSLLSLAASLRDHVRRSESMVLKDDRELQVRMTNDEQVIFQISEASVHMRRTRDGEVTQSETFRLSDQCRAIWDRSEMPNWITLMVRRQPKAYAQRVGEAKQIDETVSVQSPVELIVRTSPVSQQKRLNARATR